MTPVDEMPAGDFNLSLDSVLADGDTNPKKHEYKIKKHSPMPRIGDGDKKHM